MFRTLGVRKNRAAADAIWHQFGSLADHLLKTDSKGYVPVDQSQPILYCGGADTEQFHDG